MVAFIKQCSCKHVGMDRVCWDGEGGVGDQRAGKDLEGGGGGYS